jgi:alpha-L-arabinofuranosidase
MKKNTLRFLEAWWVCGLLWLCLVACGSALNDAVLETPLPASTTSPPPTSTTSPTALPSATPTLPALSVTIGVDIQAEGQPFHKDLLGSNLPAWLKPEGFEDQQFRQRVAASGITLLRIPGGSWGDEYGWLSCEQGEDVPGAIPCRYPWAARPTDFINFWRGVEALGASIEPMYIVNVNYTAQEAAALVAFFNALPGDSTVIGMDRNGVDWKTAGEWAALRSDQGNPEPLKIKYWEIGNEVHGGKPGASGCSNPNGWENTWTCIGEEYMLGIEGHDGMLALRKAMLAVDPSILVGVVGGSDSLKGNHWSEAVLQAGGDQVDYVVIHTYPTYHYYGNFAKEFAEILSLSQTHWADLKDDADFAVAHYAGGLNVPVVVNEYEIIPPWGQKDFRNYMNKHVDALFIADSIGQMAVAGIDMAAQWDVMNGSSDDYGNEFGLMRADGTNFRQPKYYVFPLWAQFGSVLLPVESTADPKLELSIYAGRGEAGKITLLAINKWGSPTTAQITLNGASQIAGGTMDTVNAPSLDSLVAFYNGVENPADDLSDAPPVTLDSAVHNVLTITFSPYSINLILLNSVP